MEFAFFLFLIAFAMTFVVVGLYFTYNENSMDDDDSCLIHLLVAVIKCDGKVDTAEVDAVRSFIISSPRWGNYLLNHFSRELGYLNVRFMGYGMNSVPMFILEGKSNYSQEISKKKVSDLASYALTRFAHKYSDRLELMDSLFQIAYSQDGVSDDEVNLLREVAHYLCIKSWDFTGLLYKYEYMMDEQQKRKKREEKEQDRTEKDKGSEEGRNERQKAHEARFKNVTDTRTKEALQLLEIMEDADAQEIKSAYRRMAKKYHPDTLPANVSEEEKEEAAARFRSIHEAYDFLLVQESVKR